MRCLFSANCENQQHSVLGTICVNNSFLRFVVDKSNLLVFLFLKLGSVRVSVVSNTSKSRNPSKGADVSFLTLQLLPNPLTSTSARMPSTLSKANFHEQDYRKVGQRMLTSSSKESPRLSNTFRRLGLKVLLEVVGGNV